MCAVSAPPHVHEVEQFDGSKIPVRMFGHEYYNWMETVDGYVIEYNEHEHVSGWYYSVLNEEGNFMSSNIPVVYPASNDLMIPRHLRESAPRLRDLTYQSSRIDHFQNQHLKRGVVDSTLKPLVLLVDFNDQEHEYTASQFQHLIFSENLSPVEANFPSDHVDYTMSVRDYYDEISNGKQQIMGNASSVIDWKRAKNDYDYYVDGSQGTGEGVNGISRSAASLIVEISMAMDEEIDFSQFDNGDGAIDVVVLIVAGKGGQSNNHFWPHMFVVPTNSNGLLDIDPNASHDDSGYFLLDGVVIRKYIVIQEKYAWNHGGAEVDMIHPIGTLCHELGHILGLPDLYDTSELSASGIGEWGLMGSGNWQNQTSPAYMSAWSRYRLGYISPIIIEDVVETHVDILPAEEYEEANSYIFPMNPNMPQEYILIENRQKLGSDQYLAGSGLLAWHVDETITDMYPAINSVNVNSEFYGVNLLQADGQDELYSSSGNADSTDPFQSGDGPLNGSSNPSLDMYDYDRDADGVIEIGGESNVEISNFSTNVDGIFSLIVTNPNQHGDILSYDEGNYEGIAFPKVENQLEWAGIRVVSPSTALLSGIQTVFPPSYSPVSNVTDYTINVWSGWIGSKPERLLCTYQGNVEWTPELSRDGGFAFISLLDKNIIWNRGETYYVEVNFNGTGYMYFFDQGIYSNNQSDGMSYYRGSIQSNCILLSNQNHAENGDWNIRVVLSGQNCGLVQGEEVWPGDTNGDSNVDAEDIIPIGVYLGEQGCQRNGDAYSWESMTLPDGWEVEEATRADANGDGIVSIADVLVVLVNWEESITNVSIRMNQVDFSFGLELEEYRENFHQIYQSLSGDSVGEIIIREKLEELFGFGIFPTQYKLGDNFPNPFNSTTTIPYHASNDGEISIGLHDILGRKVESFNHSHKQEGWHEIVLDLNELSSGIYFYQLESNGKLISQKKMLLLK